MSTSLGGGHYRIKPNGIKVAIVDLLTGDTQRRDDRVMKCSCEAVGERMGVKNENAHLHPPRATPGS
jgi:hypothetical protein